MAIEKLLNTRIQLKYDSWDKWNSTAGQAVVLRKGEMGICYIPADNTAVSGDATRPQILFKVGDGTSAFSTLPWASAKAADVYEWAKAPNKPTYRAGEIEGLTDYISGQIQDTNTDTRYTFQIPADGEDAGKLVVTSTLYDKGVATSTTEKKVYDLLTSSELDAKLATLNLTGNVESGKYVASVTQSNGQIAIEKADLPTYTLATGTTNGTVSFNGTEISVAGLGSAAYTESTAYATSAQGEKADSALQASDIGSGTNNGTIKVKGTDVAVSGLGSAAYTDTGDYATSTQGSKADTAVQTATFAGTALTKTGTALSISKEDARTALGMSDFATVANLDKYSLKYSETDKEFYLADENGNKQGEGIDATPFIKDGMLTNVEYNATNNTLTFTWNTDSGIQVDTVVLSDILDPYVAVDTNTIDMTISGTNISADVKDGSIGTTQLSTGVNESLGKADSAVQSVTVLGETLSNGGELTVAEAKTALGLKSAAYTESTAYATAAQGTKADSAIQSVAISTGSSNGKVKLTVDGVASEADVYGLGTAAYTASTAYATSAQGALADSALQKEDISTGAVNGTILVDGKQVKVAGLASAAYTDSTDYATAGQGKLAERAVQDITVGTGLKKTINNTPIGGTSTQTAAYNYTSVTGLTSQVTAPTPCFVTVTVNDKVVADNVYITSTPIGIGSNLLQNVDALSASGTATFTFKKAHSVNIDIDEAITFVFNCGDSEGKPLV